jgi:hypothetical protein
MRVLAIAVSLLAAACSGEPTEAEACAPRIERMREELASGYTSSEAPRDVAPWVQELYTGFVATSDMYARAAILQDGVGRTIDGCYGLADAFRAAANAPVSQRRAAMAREVPAALSSCSCRGVDVESLGFLLRLAP